MKRAAAWFGSMLSVVSLLALPDRATAVGDFAHPFAVGAGAAVASLLPLSQPAQNYVVEAILGGVYHYASSPFYAEVRPEGLLTRGAARFTSNPVICLVGLEGQPVVQSAVEALLAEAVSDLSGGNLAATFLPVPCWSGPPPTPPACSNLPAGRITAFLLETGPYMGVACQGSAELLPAGGAITGGLLLGPRPDSSELSPDVQQTLRHEFGHVFGLSHTWGDPNVMLYRSGRTVDFAPLEIEALSALYEVPPGVKLQDLINMGVIANDPAVLNEPPAIEEIALASDYSEKNHGAVGQDIYIFGQRLTLAFGTESVVSFRPFNYAPLVVTFGNVPIVPDLRSEYQSNPTNWFGAPAGALKVTIPPGAGVPVHLSTRGQGTTFSGFALDGPAVPSPPATPNAVVGFTCQKTPEGNFLLWSLPSTFADGITPLEFHQVRRRILRNGVVVAELDDGLGFTDTGAYPPYEAHLYQVVLVSKATGGVGIPSSVCALASSLAPATFTPTGSPTATASATRTPTHVEGWTPLPTATATPTVLPRSSATPTATFIPSATPTPSATGTPAPTAAATPTPTPSCSGDCTSDGHVTIDEILAMVNIALGNAGITDCPAADGNHDAQITVDEILTAVNNALNGCVPVPSPTAGPQQVCVNSGGTVSTALCCLGVGDFPNTCGIGACGCSPTSSHEVQVCTCASGKCFGGAGVGCVTP